VEKNNCTSRKVHLVNIFLCHWLTCNYCFTAYEAPEPKEYTGGHVYQVMMFKQSMLGTFSRTSLQLCCPTLIPAPYMCFCCCELVLLKSVCN